jgi:uncharacterized protein
MNSALPANRLIREKSPYLLQHAHNPVDWFPWGEEAFAKAKAEDKPILVSIGYSTCHWCHVMERESYEDPQVAAIMNATLVNIKVDREERPDVDKIYMTAISAMTGSGGWPLNVFITPDLKPFFGGTYFPPSARWGQPGWTDVVQQVDHAWKDPEQRKKILDAGEHLTQALRQMASTNAPPAEGKAEWLDRASESFRQSFDRERGGFSPAPKFPMPVYQNFLLRYYARVSRPDALEMVLQTLRAMAKGGIYDHLGGGFARYSTDANWHVPHFEKMLYDNAQLAVNYLETFQVTREQEFADVARETLDYVLREMTQPEGGFYSAEDADSLPVEGAREKIEGAYYVWENDEVLRILSEKAGPLFCFRYGVRENGNALNDPHGEFKNKNILYLAHPVAEAARHFKMEREEADGLLRTAKQTLLAARQKRPRPHLDDKVLSAWNGLMITAFAKGAQVLGEPRYAQAAGRCAAFLKRHLYDEKTQTLYRRWRDGERLVPGIADDYAFLIQGLLDLFETGFETEWLTWARVLADQALSRFYDAERGGFFMTDAGGGKDLIVRVKEDTDNVEPSASSVMALNLLRLHALTDRNEYRAAAEQTLRNFGGPLEQTPKAMPQLLVALDWALSDPRQIVIAGEKDAADTRAMLQRVYAHFLPVKTILLAGATPASAAMPPIDGRATAYVCVHRACQSPTNDLESLEKQLNFR